MREFGALAQKVRFGAENGIGQGSRADLPYAETCLFGMEVAWREV